MRPDVKASRLRSGSALVSAAGGATRVHGDEVDQVLEGVARLRRVEGEGGARRVRGRPGRAQVVEPDRLEVLPGVVAVLRDLAVEGRVGGGAALVVEGQLLERRQERVALAAARRPGEVSSAAGSMPAACSIVAL